MVPLVIAVGRWAEAHEHDIRQARARHDAWRCAMSPLQTAYGV
jgi:hypothetical protein